MYVVYNRMRVYLLNLLDAKLRTRIERIRYYFSLASVHEFESLLDLGCGKGLIFDVVGDLDQSRLLVGVDLAKGCKGKYQHIVADATRLPFRDRVFSLVTAFSLLEHIPEAKRGMLYAESKRVLKQTGVLAIQLPNRYSIVEGHTYLPFFGFLPSRVHSFSYRRGYLAVPSLKSVISCLKKFGFEAHDVKKCGAPFLPLGRFLCKVGLFRLFPMGYLICTHMSRRQQPPRFSSRLNSIESRIILPESQMT